MTDTYSPVKRAYAGTNPKCHWLEKRRVFVYRVFWAKVFNANAIIRTFRAGLREFEHNVKAGLINTSHRVFPLILAVIKGLPLIHALHPEPMNL